MDASSLFLTQRCWLDLWKFMLGFQRQAERIMGQDSMGNDLGVMIPGHHLWATCTDKPRVARALGHHAAALGRGTLSSRVCLLGSAGSGPEEGAVGGGGEALLRCPFGTVREGRTSCLHMDLAWLCC